MGLNFNIFKSMTMTNNSYLFFSKARFFIQNNRFLVRILLQSSSYWDSAPVPRAALLSEENVIELLNKKFQLSTDFIKNNISLCKENIEALDELLDLTIDSQIANKYALIFGIRTHAYREKALKYCFCPNGVDLFKEIGKFYVKDNVKELIIKSHEPGKDSLYVYGDPFLFQLDNRKSILTQNKILDVKYQEEYIPYDPGVAYFRNNTLYIKTLNSEFKELDMKGPYEATGHHKYISATSKVEFFGMRNEKFFQKKWEPRLKDFFASPSNNTPGNAGIIRRDAKIKNKFIINNKNN